MGKAINIASCKICQSKKDPPKKIGIPLIPISEPAGVYHTVIWHPRAFTNVPKEELLSLHIYLHVFKIFQAFAIPDITAKPFAQVFMDEIYFRYGAPAISLHRSMCKLHQQSFQRDISDFNDKKMSNLPIQTPDQWPNWTFQPYCDNQSWSDQLDWDVSFKGVLHAYNTSHQCSNIGYSNTIWTLAKSAEILLILKNFWKNLHPEMKMITFQILCPVLKKLTL